MNEDDLKEELRKKSKELGFQLFGVSDINKMENVPFPDGRGLQKPSEVMPSAKSLIMMGMVIWDEGMNVSVSTAGSGDFSGGDSEYYNLYYQIVENKAWYFCKWLRDTKGAEAIPSTTIHAKAAASLAGLGFIGHSTLVITPEYGPRVRWIAVLTELELEPDQPFTRDLCAEQPLCKNGSLCVKSCPYNAIIPGPSQGVEPGKKVTYGKCVVAHEFDTKLDKTWKEHIRRVSDRGFAECTICNLACPYGKPVVKEIIPKKRGY